MGLTTERNIMTQRANSEEAPHPLHEAYACLLSNGLDGAGEALRILVNEASRIERAQQKWLRLFEQQTPTFKWTPSGLQEVQSYPYGVTRGAPRIPFYAAATCFGSNS